MNILVINCGSSSVKYKVVDPDSGEVRRKGRVERIADEGGYDRAIEGILEETAGDSIGAVGHRVVHGADTFHDATLIDDGVVEAIESCITLAPLHNPANLSGIRAARRALPDLPQVAVFDTAFTARLPRRARTYAIDTELAESLKIRRYGFHGTSHEYVGRRAAEFLGRPFDELRLISCHLGNGASVTAIEYGNPLDTSMGMTPLEGLVMGTRSGDLDPAIVLTLLADGKRTVADVDRLLNEESGLKGLSGATHDMRDIEARADAGDDRARLAISVFAHRVRKYIGAYASAMAGVDAVLLTGGIGQNSASMRGRILQRFDFLGLIYDDARNERISVDSETPVAEVSSERSRVKALVVATDEELMIARATAKVVGGAQSALTPGPIPIAVSARHVHLNRETFEQLFGEGAELTNHKDISQPGQFASREKVNLVGPRNRIDGVRILGPFRSRNQIEISRTDEFHLGVDAPIRRSGAVKDSAAITLEGPKGTVHLTEGLICARRHIHMTPEDAERYGVESGDEVEVAITGGPRDLVFGDVLIRVNPNYVLEMHIDTDEANAAELPSRSDGELVYTEVEGPAHADIRARRVH